MLEVAQYRLGNIHRKDGSDDPMRGFRVLPFILVPEDRSQASHSPEQLGDLEPVDPFLPHLLVSLGQRPAVVHRPEDQRPRKPRRCGEARGEGGGERDEEHHIQDWNPSAHVELWR